MPSGARSLVRRDDVDIVGKGKHGYVIGEPAPLFQLFRHVLGGISIEQDGLESAFQGMHGGGDLERLGGRNDGIVIA